MNITFIVCVYIKCSNVWASVCLYAVIHVSKWMCIHLSMSEGSWERESCRIYLMWCCVWISLCADKCIILGCVWKAKNWFYFIYIIRIFFFILHYNIFLLLFYLPSHFVVDDARNGFYDTCMIFRKKLNRFWCRLNLMCDLLNCVKFFIFRGFCFFSNYLE